MFSHVKALRFAGTRKSGHKCTSTRNMQGHTGTQVRGYCGATKASKFLSAANS